MTECKVVDPDVDGFPVFSVNLFTVLIYYFEVEDVGTGMAFGFTVDVYCTGYLTAMFFYSIF